MERRDSLRSIFVGLMVGLMLFVGGLPRSFAGDSADLVVVSIDAPETAVEGEAIWMSGAIKNQGDSTTEVTFYIHFYLSEDTIITPSDIYIDQMTYTHMLVPGETSSFHSGPDGTPLPSGVTGSYYFGAIVDATHTIAESNENNNTGYDPTPINIDDDDTFSFSVLGVGDYVTSHDLNNWDADLTYYIAKLLGDVDQNERDAAVEPNDFYDEDAGADPPGADVSDLLYFTGHGSRGKLWLCDGSREYSLDYNDIEVNSDGWDLDLEWAIFATCDTLEDNNWKTVLQHGTHILCGYDGVTFDYMDNLIIYRFFILAALYRLPIVDSWKYANLLTFEGDWVCMYHVGNRNDHLWGFGDVGQDHLGTGDIIIYKTATQKSPLALDGNLTSTIKLANLSKRREVIPSLSSITPPLREIKETFNYFGFESKEIKEMKLTKEKAYYYATDNGRTVIIYPSGATIYFASLSDDESCGISISSEDNAIASAEKFVDEHGGLPIDSYLENVLPMVQVKDESTSIDGFIIKYGRKYDDREVCGYAGDGIVVEIDSKGNVRYFYKLWRDIAATGKRYVTISARECLKRALPQIRQLIKGDRYTIRNMELVYYSQPFNKRQGEVIPAWKIDIADPQGRADDYVFIDARSGKLIIL